MNRYLLLLILTGGASMGMPEVAAQPSQVITVEWTTATLAAPWSERSDFASATYAGKLWIMAGAADSTSSSALFNDVWSSENGTSWTRTTASAPWAPRRGARACVFDNRLLIIGGFDQTGNGLGDVWYTTNGEKWTRASILQPWSGRGHFGLTVYNGYMWLLGAGLGGWSNDIYYSSSMGGWYKLTDSAPWPARRHHVATTYADRIWILGGELSDGTATGDVWWSTNGIAWTQATAAAPWGGQTNIRAAVFADRLWVFAGDGTEGKNHGWWTVNGEDWIEAFDDAPWLHRMNFGLEILGGKPFVYGGERGDGGGTLRDVWVGDATVDNNHPPSGFGPMGDGELGWNRATANAAWSGRRSFASAVYNDKLWLMGGTNSGANNGALLDDVWSSVNGTSWTLVTDSPGWRPRWGHKACVFGGKLWLIGGYDNYSLARDIWNTVDGENWNCIKDAVPWGMCQEFALSVHDGRMWVMGSQIGAQYTNDVWSSTNGFHWIQATPSASWERRKMFSGVTYANKLWVMGGQTLSSLYGANDVWWSTDGAAWTQATAEAPWHIRMLNRTVVHGGRMWLLDGIDITMRSEAWQTTDGEHWTESPVPWSDRGGHGVEILNDQIFVYGGTVGTTTGVRNDVWYSSGSLSVASGAPDGTVITKLTTFDLDENDTHTYSLIDDAGGRFGIDGDRLIVSDGDRLTYDDRGYVIILQTTDAGGLSFSQPVRVEALPGPAAIQVLDGTELLENGLDTVRHMFTPQRPGTLSRSFTIRNAGGKRLELGTVTAPLPMMPSKLPSYLDPGATASLTLSIATDIVLGHHGGIISIPNGDPEDDPFRFILSVIISHIVWVDFDGPGGGTGASDAPFNTLAQAVAEVPVGGIVRPYAGSTAETIRISKPMRLETENGPVRIGATAQGDTPAGNETYQRTVGAGAGKQTGSTASRSGAAAWMLYQ